MERDKWLRCVRREREPHDPVAALGELRPIDEPERVIDVVGLDQELIALHGMPPHSPIRYELLVWEWWQRMPDFIADREVGYRVRERLVFDELPPRDAAGWRPGVKQLSFLRRPEGVSAAEFRERYARHTDQLRADQPGIAKYVQNVVEEASPGARALDGISELWFASVEDFRDRYWSGPGVAERESKETGLFLDFTRTWSLIVREYVPPA